jgi:hypothetical protein
MKEEEDSQLEIIKPISIKRNNFNFESLNNFLIDEDNIPQNLSDKDIEELKERNKFFFKEYSKLVENNNLLKFKLQELILKKNQFQKLLNKLEHKNKNDDDREGINDNNIINNDLINFPNNIYINRKRKRRKKSQITYKYKCNFKDCNKIYSTEGALNQHIKFKHI